MVLALNAPHWRMLHVLTALLPVSAANHAGVRNRTRAVGLRIVAREAKGAESNARVQSWVVVAPGGA
jgi:hypothetical protein